MTFYENFLKLCNDAGKTPSRAAKEIGISKSIISRWKSGGGVSDSTAVKIADYFGISPSDLKGTLSLDGMLYKTAIDNDLLAAARLIEDRSEEKEKPAGQMASGLRDAGYDLLTPDEKKVVDSLIEQLLSLRSRE